jgi:hypothetical protein
VRKCSAQILLWKIARRAHCGGIECAAAAAARVYVLFVLEAFNAFASQKCVLTNFMQELFFPSVYAL